MHVSWRAVRAACAATLVSLAIAHGEDSFFEGDGTTYTLGDTSSGNCNFMMAPPAAAQNYAALNNDQWLATRNCGRCAEVACADARCTSQKKEIVHILDRCPECKHGDLDLSPSVFSSITGSGPSRLKIKWRFVDCPNSGNVQYCLKGGSNAFWTAIQPANAVTGVRTMAINGQTPSMVDSAYYYLLNGQSKTQTDLGSVTVALTSVNGEVIEETVALTAGACTTGKRQFKAGNAGNGDGSSQQTKAPAATAEQTPSPQALTTKAPATNAPTTEVGSDATKPLTPTPSALTNASVNGNTNANTNTNNDFSMTDLATETTLEPGTVTAPDDAASIVRRLTPAPVNDDVASDADVQTVTTKSSNVASGTSPILIALCVVGAVGVVALAVVAGVSQKKKLEDKRADRLGDNHNVAMQRSFDTFASPVRVNADIAQL